MPTAVLAPDPSHPGPLGLFILGARLGLHMRGVPGWLAWSLLPPRLLADFRSRLTVHVDRPPTWLSYGRGARRASRDWSA